MWLLFLSFLAWVLTIVAPCVLPILPVILWGSVINGQKSRPRVIILSFAISILVFTLGIQFLVEQFGLRPSALTQVAAWILIIMGLVYLFPWAWKQCMDRTWIDKKISTAGHTSLTGTRWDIAMGSALWPIFNTCSPTYAVLIATILPASFGRGLLNILAYILWLCMMLSLIVRWGRAVMKKLRWFANPSGMFKKVIAIFLLLIWLGIMFWWDKDVEAYLIQSWLAIDTTEWEYNQVKEYR